MSTCCGHKEKTCAGMPGTDIQPLDWFGRMIENCYEYACQAKKNGKGIAGIMCEFTPRELILAAGAVPVCLCGGAIETIGSAERDLPVNLCPLIKSTYGYHVDRKNPFLEMADIVVAETTCDGKKKMFELMAQTRKMYVLELPQKPLDSDAMGHWAAELKKFKSVLERQFKVEITDAKIRKAIRTMNRERRFRRELAAVMKGERTPISGRQLLEFKSIISGIEEDLKQYEKAIEIFKAAGERASNGHVRVLLTGVPTVHGAEKVVNIIESSGGLVVCQDNCTGLKPIYDDVDEDAEDPMEALARKYMSLPCARMTSNDYRMEMLSKMFAEYRPQCIIDLIWHGCTTYDVESYFVRRLAEEKLGIPYMKVETDYSPSDSARIKLRVEALFETIQAKGKN